MIFYFKNVDCEAVLLVQHHGPEYNQSAQNVILLTSDFFFGFEFTKDLY